MPVNIHIITPSGSKALFSVHEATITAASPFIRSFIANARAEADWSPDRVLNLNLPVPHDGWAPQFNSYLNFLQTVSIRVPQR